MWSISTILTGLYCFMIESNPTLGSIETSTRKKRQLAAASLQWNVDHNTQFVKLFPEYVERAAQEKLQRQAEGHGTTGAAEAPLSHPEPAVAVLPQGMAALAGIVAILSIVVVYRFS